MNSNKDFHLIVPLNAITKKVKRKTKLLPLKTGKHKRKRFDLGVSNKIKS